MFFSKSCLQRLKLIIMRCSMLNFLLSHSTDLKLKQLKYVKWRIPDVYKKYRFAKNTTRGFFSKIEKTTDFSFFKFESVFSLSYTHSKHEMNLIGDNRQMTSIKIVQFLISPTLLVHLCPIFFHPLVLWCPISNKHPPFSKW